MYEIMFSFYLSDFLFYDHLFLLYYPLYFFIGVFISFFIF